MLNLIFLLLKNYISFSFIYSIRVIAISILSSNEYRKKSRWQLRSINRDYRVVVLNRNTQRAISWGWETWLDYGGGEGEREMELGIRDRDY